METKITFFPNKLLLLVTMLFSKSVYSQTIITVTDCNRDGWVDQRNPNTIATFTTGVAESLLGNGSLEYTTLTGALGNFRKESYHNTLLSSLTNFSYSSYIQSRTNYTDNLYVVLQIDRTGDGLEDDRLIFEPRWQTGSWVAGTGLPDQGPTVEQTWQTWDMLNAIWWLGPPNTLNPENGGIYFTLASYINQYPDAKIVNQNLGGGFGGIRLNVGSPRIAPFTEYWGAAFTGYVDAFTIGINGHNTVYDFEPGIAEAGEDKIVIYGYGSNCTTLQATGAGGIAPYSYNWSAGANTWTGRDITVCPTATTTYTLTVTDAQGCSGTDEVTVFVDDVRCGNKNDKVLVCHKGKVICIAPAAVKAHLKHGDKVGQCLENTLTKNNSREMPTKSDKAKVAENNSLKVLNYPNPFTTLTTIQYELPFDCAVSITVYDLAGRVVSPLVSENKKAGLHTVEFNKSNLTTGVYFFKITATAGVKSLTKTSKLVLE